LIIITSSVVEAAATIVDQLYIHSVQNKSTSIIHHDLSIKYSLEHHI